MLDLFKKHLQFIFIPINLALLYFNLCNWHLSWLGWVLFVFYLLINGEWWQDILHYLFYLNRQTWTTKVFSWFAIFSLLGLGSSLAIVFYHFTSTVVWSIFVLVTVLTIIIWLIAKKKRKKGSEERIVLPGPNFVLFDRQRIMFILYLILWSIGFYFLIRSESAQILNSPWQTISKYYLLIFFILTIFSGIFLFAKFKTKTILLILVLQCLLLHLYLPLSHQSPWGGDVWRHLAMENKIENGDYILPVLVGPEVTWKDVINIRLPGVFFDAHKYTYGHLWGASVLLAKTLQVNLMAVNKWLVPVVWSLVMPFLLFRIGSLLFVDKRKALWLVWLSFLPFPFQVQGALSLPVAFDFILFLFVLSLWLQYLRDDSKYQKRIALFFACLMLFSYSLYFILIWVVILLSLVSYSLSRLVESMKYKTETNKIISKATWTTIIFLTTFIIPIIELITKVSYVPQNVNFWDNFKQAIDQFSGWFYANTISSYDILSGNFIFNHTPDYAFVASIFNNWRWWLVPAMIILWVMVGLGIYKIFETRDRRYEILGLLFSTVFGGYLLGWFVLGGDRLFTRRLDIILAFLLMILIIQGISYLLSNFRFFHKRDPVFAAGRISDFKFTKVIVILLILGLSWFTTFTYVSGPDIRAVSKDEFDAAKYVEINRDKEIGDKRYCVLADTWVLFPLEALSSSQIVGGGFPIDYQFAQPERTVLFSEMAKNPRQSVLQLSHEKTGAEKCWFVTQIQNADFRMQNDKLFGSEAVEVGDLLVWKEISSTPVVAPLKRGKK